MSTLDALKDWAHRKRWLARHLERRKDRDREAAFTRYLDASIGVAVRWQRRAEVIASAREQLTYLTSIPEPPPRKGSPSKVRIRAPELEALSRAFDADVIGAQELHAAERIASIEPEEVGAFTLYLAVLWLANAPVIAAMRATPRDRIVLHMTCVPRMRRAQSSVESFPPNVCKATHLTLIGTGLEYSYERSTALLGVPAGDAYECLPQKVFQAVSMIVLAHNPSVLLKVDDDHRLVNARELDELFTYAAMTNEAVQLGEVNRTPFPSAHHRGWHFGKCAQQELNVRILEMPAPVEWVAGSSGYMLNRAAMWRMSWAALYYRQWLNQILYEDLALGEVATKTGIRLVNVPINRALDAVTDY